MDILVKIPFKLWARLRDSYNVNCPKGVTAYCLLDTLINNPKLSETFNFEVYCPFGDLYNGMVGFTKKNGHTQIFILPLNNTSKIEEALLKTKLINWNENIIVPFASPEAVDCLMRLSEHMRIKIHYEDGKAIKHLLTKNTTLFDISLPADTYIAPLKPEYIDIVDKTWSYYNEQSNKFFIALMENDMTYVLYSCDHEPLAWITINEAGALTHLFCLEPFRRKGYAEIVTKFACNDVFKKDGML